PEIHSARRAKCVSGAFAFWSTRMTQSETRSPVQFMDWKAIKAAGWPYSRGYTRQLELEGKFPKRVPLGTGRVVWVKDEYYDAAAKLIEQRDNGTAPKPRQPLAA